MSSSPEQLTVLTWNIWGAPLMRRERTEAIARMLGEWRPDIVMLQEVTPVTYDLLVPLAHPDPSRLWGRDYIAIYSPDDEALPDYFNLLLVRKDTFPDACKDDFRVLRFQKTNMDRSLMSIELKVGEATLVAAVGHLESPLGTADQKLKCARVREEQLDQALAHLSSWDNVVFGGDMNWIDEIQDPMPLPRPWVDAWSSLKPSKDVGYTYDARKNFMLGPWNPYRSRLDRFLCRLRDYALDDITMVGTERIPNLLHPASGKGQHGLMLPVFPSDHFGLRLRLKRCS